MRSSKKKVSISKGNFHFYQNILYGVFGNRQDIAVDIN